MTGKGFYLGEGSDSYYVQRTDRGPSVEILVPVAIWGSIAKSVCHFSASLGEI
ncbi:hypothetical protein ACLOJK_007855 [Asimina triloba]